MTGGGDQKAAAHIPVMDYEGSQYRADFWVGQGRAYEDAAERLALQRLMPAHGVRLAEIGAGFGRLADLYREYEQVILLAREELKTALVAYSKARERLTQLEAAAAASSRAAELAQVRFEGGVADFLQVLDAQRSALITQDQLAQGRTDAVTALVAVYRASGDLL